MATEYRVNIQLNTEKVKADLKTIKTEIDKLGKVNLGTNQKTQRSEAKITKSKLAQRVAMAETRRVGDLVQKAADQGLKVARAREAVDKSSLLNSKKEFKESKAILKLALDELKIQRSISKEKAQQAAFTAKTASNNAKAMAGGPFVSTGIASSRFGSTRQEGSPRFIGSRIGMVQGPEPASVNVRPSGPFSSLSRLTANTPLGLSGVQAFPQTKELGMFGPKSPFIGQTTGFGRSSLRGNRFQFGSQAQIEFSGKGMGRSPIGGRSDLVGSLPNLNRVARDNAMPVKGFEFMPGTPAYFEKFNKDVTRIAKSKGNVLPVSGMKHLVGSPAYFKDQAKQLKKLQGGPVKLSGLSGSTFGPQQPMQGPAFPTGAAQPLNIDKRGNLLPGPLGSRQRGAGLMRALSRNRGPALQSAAISGAFPLLFGQGPLAAAGGAIGGGLGGAFGGQMGGFAGGLIGTAVVSGIQGFTNSIKDLGTALSPLTSDVNAVVSALGVTGTTFGNQLQIYTKVASKTDALNEATRQMSRLIGDDGVAAITEFGESSNALKNDFDRAMLGMQAAVARVALFIGNRFKIFDKEGTRGLSDRARTTMVGGKDKVMQEISAKRKAIISAPFDSEKGVTVDGTTFKNKTEALDFLRVQRNERQKILDLQNAGLITQKTVKDISKNQLESLTEESLVLQDTLNGGEVKAEIEARIRALKKEVLGDEEKLTAIQITQIEKQRKIITKTVTNNHKLKETVDIANQVADAFDKLKDTIAIDIGDGIKGLIRGTQTLNDVLRNVVDKLADAALNMAIFGNVGGGSVTGGILGSIFKAEGGPVKRGGSFIVGERGPELFTPGVSGMITPNHALGGSTNVVVNVDASGSSVEGDEQGGRELGRVISVAIQSELIKQKRPGGLLT